ncbi:MAG TPA: molybdopterin cofactor-binding domain-containing protein [Sphingomicrobium sp.]|nr:molybdopterin cofactor-binding domain-containing protein [Sphingomicrobium sp.]
MRVRRRELLIGGGVGVGLIVGYALWPRRLASDLAVRHGEWAFGDFIKVGRDGRVTVAVPQTETGQGSWTGLAQIVADELGAAWDTVAVEPAPLTGAYRNALVAEGGLRITAGSTSIRAFDRPMREAAAVARAMLVGAAADRWNIDPSECEAADGFVINGVRAFRFAELAEEAAYRRPPKNPPFRSSTRGRLIGQPLQRLDGPAKSAGSFRFASDIRLPSMLHAAARLAPPGGRLTGFSREAVRAVPAVRHLHARDNAFVVVADNWWTAEQAVKAADPRFSVREAPTETRLLFDDALAHGSFNEAFNRGDFDGVTRGSRPLAATYYVAPSLHLGLEPLTATARFSGDHVEVWAASQAPEAARASAEEEAPGARVTFYPLPAGEPAGRALEADLIPLAMRLARATGRPVQLTLSQSGSQNHDHPSGGALARMMALPGAGGITAAWKMRVAMADGFGAAVAALSGEIPPGRLGASAFDGCVPPYSIPNVAIEGARADVPFEAGYMRASPQREYCFFTESFVDELAHAAGMEPLAFRMSMLGGNPRLARCFQSAAQLAQWDGGGRGSTLGIAGCSAFDSHIALVANATIGEDQQVKVHRLVAAVDCGRIVNSGLVIQQVAGGLMWALGQATVAEPEWVAGMPRARAMRSIGLPRIADTPDITVQLIKSNAAPGGVSGLATTVLAPAVANAIHAGIGKRMRSLPFDPMSVA